MDPDDTLYMQAVLAEAGLPANATLFQILTRDGSSAEEQALGFQLLEEGEHPTPQTLSQVREAVFDFFGMKVPTQSAVLRAAEMIREPRVIRLVHAQGRGKSLLAQNIHRITGAGRG